MKIHVIYLKQIIYKKGVRCNVRLQTTFSLLPNLPLPEVTVKLVIVLTVAMKNQTFTLKTFIQCIK